MVNNFQRSGQSTISDLTKNTPIYDVKFAAPHVRETDLSFGTGAAGYMLESIVVHLDIMPAQDRIANNHEHGSTFKERIQNDKLVTGGAIFCNGSSRQGQTILEVQNERKQAALVKQGCTYKKSIQ